jgi:hypothetical protein
MNESLTIAIVAPLLDRVPWSIRSTKLAGDLEKDMGRTCGGCGIPIGAGKGLVCGNFGTKQLHWALCQGAWHGSYYRQKEADRFPIQSTRNQEEVDFEEEDGMVKEEGRFRVGCDGDHLLCPNSLRSASIGPIGQFGCLAGTRGQHSGEQPAGRKAREEGRRNAWGQPRMGSGHRAVPS